MDCNLCLSPEVKFLEDIEDIPSIPPYQPHPDPKNLVIGALWFHGFRFPLGSNVHLNGCWEPTWPLLSSESPGPLSLFSPPWNQPLLPGKAREAPLQNSCPAADPTGQDRPGQGSASSLVADGSCSQEIYPDALPCAWHSAALGGPGIQIGLSSQGSQSTARRQQFKELGSSKPGLEY